MYRRDFERILLEAVDEEFTYLGESSKQALYFHLERGFNIKKHEIPQKTEAFAKAMEKIFGIGADYLEILIMKRLYGKIGGDVKLKESKDLKFTEYVTALKQSFLVKEKAGNKEERAPCEQIKIRC